MYCPECGVEYREGFMECADCHSRLLAGPPPDLEDEPMVPSAPPDPNLKIVTILETADPIVLATAISALEEAKIPFYVPGGEFAPIMDAVAGAPPWGGTSRRIEVGQDREVEARRLLREIVT